VNSQSLEQAYSSKTDDELLALLADKTSLREEAQQILFRELQRRGLDRATVADDGIKNSRTLETAPGFSRSVKFVCILIFNIFIAVLGTAALEAEIGSVVHPRSIAGLLWKWWDLDLFCAALIGSLVWRKWKAKASMWTWAVPAVWFGFRFLFALMVHQQQSVLVSGHGVWHQFSGADCQNGYRLGSRCVNYWAFTAPFVRALAYSIGAYLSSKIVRNAQHEHSAILPGSQPAQ
jgi:hypothetical protein